MATSPAPPPIGDPVVPADPAARLSQVLEEIAALGHRINNPLTAVVGRSQLLRLQEGTDPRVLRSAELIAESAERIADVVRELTRLVHRARDAMGEIRGAESGGGDGPPPAPPA